MTRVRDVEDDDGKTERSRRASLALVSVASVWAASLRNAERCARAALGGGREPTFDIVASRARDALEEVETQRMAYGACVERAIDGCARREGEARDASAAAPKRAGDANERRVRALGRKSRRCARAVSALGEYMALAHDESARAAFGPSFWTPSCADLSPTLDPKRAVLVVMKTTDDDAVTNRMHLANLAYVASVNATVSNLLQNLNARASYDASYLDAKTQHLQNISGEAQRLVTAQYAYIYNASTKALVNVSLSTDGAMESISNAAAAVAEDADALAAAAMQNAADFAESAEAVAEYTRNVASTFDTYQNFIDIVRSAELMDSSIEFPDLSMPTLQLNVPDVDLPALDFSGIDAAADVAAQIASASADAASASILRAVDEVSLLDIGANLSIPTILEDYDPPPYRSADGASTTNSNSFGSHVFNSLASASDAFSAVVNVSTIKAGDAFAFATNVSVNASEYLRAPNITSAPRPPTADDFKFLGVSFEGLNVRLLFAKIDGAFAGLVNIDWTYRIIRCVQIVARHMAYGALELEPLNLTEQGSQLGTRKIKPLERVARLFSDPIMVSFARFAIFSAVVLGILHLYRQTHQTYILGCVAGRNGTFTGNNAYVMARSYVNSRARVRAVAHDSYAQYNSSRACESYRTSNIERFNEHEIERHKHEQALVESQTILQAIETCVKGVSSSLNVSNITISYARAEQMCSPESFSLDANVTFDCPPTACLVIDACIGPVDDVLRRQSIETGCALEDFAHEWVQRFVVLLLAYVSINIVREPLVLALSRAVTNAGDVVPCLAHYHRSSDDVSIRTDAREVVEHTLWQYRVRAFVVIAACCIAQSPWLALADYFSKSKSN